MQQIIKQLKESSHEHVDEEYVRDVLTGEVVRVYRADTPA